MSAHRAYVGIGSNLGNRFENVERALAALGALGAIVARSSLYRTAPWGNPEQPWFLNAVVVLQTELAPRMLLQRLRAVEDEAGRTRVERWGARTLDLDLLLYDDLRIDEPDLRVPHPLLRERAFVLVPLSEIDARFGALRDALSAEELAGVVRVEREQIASMPPKQGPSASERVRALAAFLAKSDVTRVRVRRGDDDVEIAVSSQRPRLSPRSDDRPAADQPPQRVDTIKADLVGIFHASRPTPVEGDLVDGDRELGYIEALGIRTPVHSMGSGRLVSVATADGAPVEYGQPLFLMVRGQ